MSEYEREIELYDYIEVLLKYKWFILAATLVCGGAGWLMRPDIPPPFYEADVVLMIKNLSLPQATNGEIAAVQTNQSSGFYQYLALADDLKQDLIDNLDLKISPRVMDGMLQVAILDPGIKLTTRSYDPTVPIPLVNEWAKLFVERNSDLNVDEVGSYYNYVVSQYDTARTRLDDTEADLHALQTANRIGFLQVQQGTLDTAATKIYQEIVKREFIIRRKILDLKSVEERIALIEKDDLQAIFAHSLELESSLEMESSIDGLEDVKPKHQGLVKIWQIRSVLDMQYVKELRAFEEKYDFQELEKTLKEAGFILKELRAFGDLYSTRKEILEQKLRTINSIEKELDRVSSADSLVTRALVEKKAELLVEYAIARAQKIEDETADRPVDEVITSISDIEQLRDKYFSLLENKQKFTEKYNTKRAELAREEKRLRDILGLNWESYIGNVVKRDSILSYIQALEYEKDGHKIQFDTLHKQMEAIKNETSDKMREQRRLIRDQEIFSGTVSRFSKLVEEARITREKAAGDIRILTRALEVRTINQSPGQQKAAIAAGVGFLLSSIFSLLVEYMRKAKQRRSATDTE